jgi:hypothetical protein
VARSRLSQRCAGVNIAKAVHAAVIVQFVKVEIPEVGDWFKRHGEAEQCQPLLHLFVLSTPRSVTVRAAILADLLQQHWHELQIMSNGVLVVLERL